MKILHLTTSLDPQAGGVSQAVKTIISGLQPLGVQNEVACVDTPDAGFLAGLPFAVYALGPAKTPWAYSASLLPWLRQHLADYTAIIVHGLWQYHTYAITKAWEKLPGNRNRPGLFVMPHGMLDPYFQRAKGRQLKALRNRLFWNRVDSMLVNRANGLLFTCETEKLLARQPFSPYRPKAEIVTGLGIEPPPPYNPAMKAAFEKKIATTLPPYWLYISRIHEKKGTDLLVQAYRALKKEQGSLPPLIIAGPGLDTPYGQQVLQQAAADPAIFFPGMLTGDAKWGAFYGCEVFVLPSHQENFGIAVVEALACGKPVLISDQVNIWREIIGGGAGLSSKDTPAGIYQLLRQWLQPGNEGKTATGRQAMATYRQHFSLESTSANIFSALQNTEAV